MPYVQMQRLRNCAGGPVVVSAIDVELVNHREYLEAINAFERDCGEDEFTRTVAEGAPLYVGAFPEPQVRPE